MEEGFFPPFELMDRQVKKESTKRRGKVGNKINFPDTSVRRCAHTKQTVSKRKKPIFIPVVGVDTKK